MSTSDPTTRASSFADTTHQSPNERGGISTEEALHWLKRAAKSEEAHAEMLDVARRIRDREIPIREIAFCGILQAKVGGCVEDCAFCCQSLHHHALGSAPRGLSSVDEIMNRARTVKAMGARAFSIVTAGRHVASSSEVDTICRVIEQISTKLGLETCASLGRVRSATFRRLVDAGLDRYHHNLESSPSFFQEVISTYAIDESLETISIARDEGLAICSSGVFGLGETDDQRVELVDLLRSHNIESLPICFLEPQPGTPLEGRSLLEIDEAQRIIALHRLMLPAADVIITGGRWSVFGERQGAAIDAGANGVMVGDYPTTFSGELEIDHRMVSRRGFALRKPLKPRRPRTR